MGMTECYGLKDVVVGKESIMARPVGWDKEDYDGFGHDKDGNDVNAIQWHATCPACAQLLDFEHKDVYVVDNVEYVGCSSCKTGEKPEISGISGLAKEELGISNPVDIEELVGKLEDAKFIDPIADGLFDIKLLKSS